MSKTLKKATRFLSIFLCAVLIFQSFEIGIFATTEQTDETLPEDESFCLCENCTEYECSCECETEEACNCIQCKRTAYTEYDDFGNVIAEKSFDGTKTMTAESYVYSEDGTQLLSSTDSSGNTAYYTYNEAGLVETVSAGSSSGTATYDEAGNLLSFSQNVSGLSDGSVMSNSYTYENDKVKTITHNGFSYEFSYDESGNQTETKIGDIVFVENTYETVEDVDRLTDTSFINGQTVSYEYDDSGNITGVLYDGTERYSYTYDEEGILQSETDNQAGITTVYTENGTELRETDSNTLLYSSYYDEDGNEIRNVAGSSITYNADSSYNDGTGEYTDILSFEKEATLTQDGVTSVYINDTDVTVNTDWFGRVYSKNVELETSKDDVTSTITSSIAYNYADTDTTATTKITSMTSNIVCGENTYSKQEYYEYDAVGNITGIYRLAENEKIYYNKYYYDEANQIVREDNRLGEFSCTYTYDVGGNIVSRIRYPYTEGDLTGLTPEETHSYTYENTICGDLLTGYNGQSISYDNMGNTTSLDGVQYEWTAGRQLSRMVYSSEEYTEYLYNSDGQLYCLKMYNANGNFDCDFYYTWEDTKLSVMGIVFYIKDENGNVTDEELLYSRVIYDSDGEALGYLINDAIPFLYTKNILGDITGLVNGQTGQLIFNYVYDAYGNLDIKTPDNTLEEAIGAIIIMATNPLSYRGYLYAPMAGYSYYLGSRYYVPNLCRFMNADVYADTAQGVVATNMFAYCNNNPIMFIDPDGTDAFSDLFVIFSNAINAVLSVFKNILGNGGNSLRNAVDIDLDNSIYATISKAKEVDWFKFKPGISCAINLFTEGELDTKIELCTKTILGKEKVLVSNNNSGNGLNARIEYEVKANTQYYVKVSTNNKKTGLYKLILESNYDCMYSPSGGSWIPNNRNYEPYGTLRFEKKVYLTKDEAQGYYMMVEDDKLREFCDDLSTYSLEALVGILEAIYPIFSKTAIIEFIAYSILLDKVPTPTEMELEQIKEAGNINDKGYMQNGIVIICVSDIYENFSGETIREYSNYYSSWDGANIYGEKYYRGHFDVNDKSPL